jgi:hypothetical protein
MTSEQEIQRRKESITHSQQQIQLYRGCITNYQDEIKRNEDEIAKLQQDRKFCIGDRFHNEATEFILVLTVGKVVRLIDVNTGRDKAGYNTRFDIPVLQDGYRQYVMRLPTAFVTDFGLDPKYAGRVING